ncbi:hypothetical protein L226DRAFT_136161 [Lentinus tigrinus ALCF2SS1-7]|uniref:uncharacterized protein n=1 Tax=Lentinus tigrinus ALCF2SS1-7 TaxID=1328758 RepID=UPI00116637C7|nr:hypothetical protein L226DRAFT_136161 [Lentinus tigrinus ALCF2SS1-7]
MQSGTRTRSPPSSASTIVVIASLSPRVTATVSARAPPTRSSEEWPGGGIVRHISFSGPCELRRMEAAVAAPVQPDIGCYGMQLVGSSTDIYATSTCHRLLLPLFLDGSRMVRAIEDSVKTSGVRTGKTPRDVYDAPRSPRPTTPLRL